MAQAIDSLLDLLGPEIQDPEEGMFPDHETQENKQEKMLTTSLT